MKKYKYEILIEGEKPIHNINNLKETNLRDVLKNLNKEYYCVSPNSDAYYLDYYLDGKFTSINIIDLSFREYDDYDIKHLELTEDGYGGVGPLLDILEIYKSTEQFASNHPIATMVLCELIKTYGLPRLKKMFKVLKRKVVKPSIKMFNIDIRLDNLDLEEIDTILDEFAKSINIDNW